MILLAVDKNSKPLDFEDINFIYPLEPKGVKILLNCGKTLVFPEFYYADIVEDLKWILKEKLSHK